MILVVVLVGSLFIFNSVLSVECSKYHHDDSPTPLQVYCAKPDDSYQYSVATTLQGADTTTYVLRLTSQRWLTEKDTNAFLWQHWLQVVVPHQLEESNQTAIYVDGGGDSVDPPTNQDIIGISIAVQTKTIIGHLNQIPNEPTYFYEEGCCKGRNEDAILAYGWSHYMNDTTKPDWIVRLPMVKAVMRAMDAMQDFLPKIGHIKPEKFIIAGASKRGWVTWLTPAVDPRVNAIVPMVMPILHMVPLFNQMWRSLGEWTFAFSDYVDMNIPHYYGTPAFEMLAEVIDPVYYMKYLDPIPKYMIFSTGDEFFPPDASRNFYEELLGQKFLRMMPNTEHSLAPLDDLVINNIAVFATYIKHGDTLPYLTEKLVYSNSTASITVYPSSPPDQVKVWIASTTSSIRRDFRLLTCRKLPDCFQPVFWLDSVLNPNPDGSYSHELDPPVEGWLGFLIEVSWKSKYDSNLYYQITSQAVVVPDVYPFPSFNPN